MGGAAGHMAHLHEDLDLTFTELISIINQVASADIEVTEKVDGQNLFLSAREQISLTVDEFGAIEIRTARNPTDIRRGGMTTDEYAAKWQGHPAEDAFMKGFQAIRMAIDSLSTEDVIDIFDGGESYVNMEIMYPGNPNIINYGASYVVLHGLVPQSAESSEAFERLSSKLNAAQVEVDGETWSIYGPQIIPLQNIANRQAHKDAISKIQEIADASVGMESSLGELAKAEYLKIILMTGLDEEVAKNLTDIVFEYELHPDRHDKEKNKALRKIRTGKYNQLKKSLTSEEKQIASRVATFGASKSVISSTLRELEAVISDFAIEVLRGLKSFFAVDHEGAIREIRDELEESIEFLRDLAASGDEKMGQLVDRQLSKLGNIENVASSLEGIVFEHGGKIYKMTGAFAMANQIIGRARRSKPAQETTVSEAKIRKMVRESITRTYLTMLKNIK